MSFKLKGEKLERIESATENIINAIVGTLFDKVPRQKSFKLFEEKSSTSHSVSAQMNKVFGRQKTIHQILGGGKCK
jgi:type IV secretory pathway VirB4 component